MDERFQTIFGPSGEEINEEMQEEQKPTHEPTEPALDFWGDMAGEFMKRWDLAMAKYGSDELPRDVIAELFAISLHLSEVTCFVDNYLERNMYAEDEFRRKYPPRPWRPIEERNLMVGANAQMVPSGKLAPDGLEDRLYAIQER